MPLDHLKKTIVLTAQLAAYKPSYYGQVEEKLALQER